MIDRKQQRVARFNRKKRSRKDKPKPSLLRTPEFEHDSQYYKYIDLKNLGE
tara:strand:- start:152 stop:304 length:153 start_codon:yes stop_codon:yes gene_type:complete